MPDQSKLGVLYLCLGVMVFSVQDAIVKYLSGDYPLTLVVSIRCIVSVPILLAMVHFEAGLHTLFSRNFWPLVLRSALMLVAYSTYYMAFPALPLADAVALFFTVPLFVVVLAAIFLGERVGWRQIVAVVVGFVGVIIMLRPGSGVFEAAALLSLLSAATYALSMLMARKFGSEDSAPVMAFYQNGVYLAGALLIAGLLDLGGIRSASHPSLEFLVRPWSWPPLNDLLVIGSCGVIAAIAMTLLTNAYRIGRASVVTSFEYTGMIWAPLWGFLVFGEVPHLTTFLGAGLIIAAGLFALSRPVKPVVLPVEPNSAA